MHIEEHISMHLDSHLFLNSLDVLCPLTSFFLFLLIFMLRHRSAEGTAINKHIIAEELSWEFGCGWRLLGRNLSLYLMYDRSPFPSLYISLNDGGGDEVVG